jgi:Fe-S-cluster-containing dehydrogenase component
MSTQDKPEQEGPTGAKSSRRDFLKLAGAGMATALVATSLVKLNAEVKPGRKVKKWETASGAIVQDTNRCVGCRRCETSCTLLNDKKVSAKISRIKIARNQNYGRDGVTGSYGFGDGQLGNFRIIADTCRQCSQPKCGDNCPVGAIVVDKKTKARVVDEKKCIGCGSCARSCPWQIATLDPETVVATKCLSNRRHQVLSMERSRKAALPGRRHQRGQQGLRRRLRYGCNIRLDRKNTSRQPDHGRR